MRTLLFLCLVICTACGPDRERSARHLRRTALASPAVAAALDETTAPEPTLPDPATATTLDELVAIGVARHPGIRARQTTMVRQARRLERSGILPMPRLSVTPIGEMAQTAAGEVTLMASLSQAFPSAGARDAEVIAASADLLAADASLQTQVLAVAATIRRAWWGLRFARASEDLVRAQEVLLQDLLASIERNIAAARARQSDALRLGIEIDDLRNQQRSWRERAVMAEAMLRQTLSLADDAAVGGFAADLPDLALPDDDELIAIATARRPDLLSNAAQARRADAIATAAGARRRPDLSLVASYAVVDDHNLRGPTSGDDQWSLGVSVGLPIWTGAYSAGDREAEAARLEARLDRQAINERIVQEIRSARATWESSRDQLRRYETGLLDQARQAYTVELAAYTSGQGGSFQDVVQAWRRLLALELAAHRLRRDQGLAQADLLQALGLIDTVLPSTDTPDGSQP